MIEEEGTKNRSAKINVSVPTDVAIYLLNHKRNTLVELENKYKIEIIVSADNSIKCVSDYKIERTKAQTIKEEKNTKDLKENGEPEEDKSLDTNEAEKEETAKDISRARRGRRGRFERRRGRNNIQKESQQSSQPQEAVILYDSYGTSTPKEPTEEKVEEKKGKSAWWKKLIKG